MSLTLAKAIDRYLGSLVCYLFAGLRLLRNLIASQDSMVEVRTILLVKFWGLGNVVLLLPVVRALRERYPGARIVFVSFGRNREVLDACGDLDRRIYIDDRNVLTLVFSLFAAIFRVRRERPDVALDFEQFARSAALLAALGGARQILGLATPGQVRSVLYHKAIPYDDHQHMGQTYLDLALAAGARLAPYEPLPVPYGPEATTQVDDLLAGREERPLVVLHPGSGDNFQGRRWPAASFSELADHLAEEFGALVVVTGSPGERALVSRVCAACRSTDRIVDAAGRVSVLGLAALVDRADLLVSNDTAPVHLGSASGTPVFALFGPNTPRLYGPLSPGSHAFYRELPCSPCLTNMNYKTSLCRMPVCIRDIEVAEVLGRIREHLARDPAGSATNGAVAEPGADEGPSPEGGRRARAG